MELWFSDYHTEKVKVSVKVQKQLFGLQTEFQRIDVFDSDEFGRFLSADGSIVFSEKDEFIYDEMIVHVPMAVHPHVKNVLVIGGGDGGVARELGYYEEIEKIDVVEPDRAFVEASAPLQSFSLFVILPVYASVLFCNGHLSVPETPVFCASSV